MEFTGYNAKYAKKSYVGQTGSSSPVRHREHIRYIKTNNSLSAYAMHILNNQHEYGKSEHTLQILQSYQNGKLMNIWESLYIQIIQQQHLLIEQQRTNESNPLYSLANTSHHTKQFYSSSVDTRHSQL